jgi:hypothetical protein
VATTYVHYMYHAPGSAEGVEIAVKRWPGKSPDDVLPSIGSVGNTTKVTPDDPDEYGDMREFEVLGVVVGPSAYWQGTPATISNMLIVDVTELD